jgi:hypothetical protein
VIGLDSHKVPWEDPALPPSPPNSAALQARYKELSRENIGPIWHTVNLEHGIAVVQKT